MPPYKSGPGEMSQVDTGYSATVGFGKSIQSDLDSSGVRLSVLCMHSLVRASFCALSFRC